VSKKENFALIRYQCHENSDMARRFQVPGFQGSLPFLVSGDEVEALQRGENIEMKESHLLFGILFGLHESKKSPYLDEQPGERDTYLYLLDLLWNGFHFKTPEEMILNSAAYLRNRNGNIVSRIVLEVGKELMPESSRIKCDLIMDLWSILAEDGDDQTLLMEVLDLVPELKPEDLHSDAKQVAYYYGLCATVLMGKTEDIPYYVKKYLIPHVKYGSLKGKMKALLDNPKSFTAKELEIIPQQ
jgi:hypothetical protein